MRTEYLLKVGIPDDLNSTKEPLVCIFATSLRSPDDDRSNVANNTVNDRVDIINGLSSTCVSYTAHHLHQFLKLMDTRLSEKVRDMLHHTSWIMYQCRGLCAGS